MYRDQLPLEDDKRNILMTEFMKLKEPANAGGLRHIMAESGLPITGKDLPIGRSMKKRK